MIRQIRLGQSDRVSGLKKFFKLNRRSVSERGMQPFAVVHFLNERGKPNLEIFHNPVFPEIDLFVLLTFDEALSGGIVVRISLPGHADPEAVVEEHLT